MSVKNTILTDRRIRLVFGVVLILLSIILFFINQVHIGIAVFGIGLIPIAFSLAGTCTNCGNKDSTDQSSSTKAQQ